MSHVCSLLVQEIDAEDIDLVTLEEEIGRDKEMYKRREAWSRL